MESVIIHGLYPFGAWQTRAWLVLIVEANTPIALAGHVAIWLVSIVCGIIAAKFGETLLFGTGCTR